MSFVCFTCLKSGNYCNIRGHYNVATSHKWRWPRTAAGKPSWVKSITDYPYGGWTDEFKKELIVKMKEAKGRQ